MTYYDDFKLKNSNANKGNKTRKSLQKGSRGLTTSKNLFEYKYCINCGVRLPKKVKTCPDCGAINDNLSKSSAICVSCGTNLPFRAVYCQKCGTPVDTTKKQEPVLVNPDAGSIVCKCTYCGAETTVAFGNVSARCQYCDSIFFVDEALSYQDSDNHIRYDDGGERDKSVDSSYHVQNNGQFSTGQNTQNSNQNNGNVSVPTEKFYEETPSNPIFNLSKGMKIVFPLLAVLLILRAFSGGDETIKEIPKEETKPPKTVEMPKEEAEPPKATETVPKPKSNVATPKIEYGTYIGNRGTHVFHRESCGSVSRMKGKNKVYFANRNEAYNSGYAPCQRCNP